MSKDVTKVISAIGLNIRRKREEQGISQEELALKTDLDRTYISGIERGRRNPSVKNLILISQALNTKLSDLLSTD